MLGNFKGYTVSSNGTVYSKKDKEEMRTRVRKLECKQSRKYGIYV